MDNKKPDCFDNVVAAHKQLIKDFGSLRRKYQRLAVQKVLKQSKWQIWIHKWIFGETLLKQVKDAKKFGFVAHPGYEEEWDHIMDKMDMLIEIMQVHRRELNEYIKSL